MKVERWEAKPQKAKPGLLLKGKRKQESMSSLEAIAAVGPRPRMAWLLRERFLRLDPITALGRTRCS